ncbi:MAG: hemerythrin domain-containing protein [Ilumatobacteraceae bacterium]
MCDYCGCRRSGPTAELTAEHRRLLELGEILRDALHDGVDASIIFVEFVRLLQKHAAKEEIGLFDQARSLKPLADQIEGLCREHADLRLWLANGPAGGHVQDALRLLVTHIDDEEYDLFPHIFNALDPEQWDEIELAHRAIDAVWGEDELRPPAVDPVTS